nr:8-hydroxygeraniol dehydrogenase-like [Tanacetum cinerariifolium]
ATGDKDVRFKVLYCGICHTDVHFAKNEWGVTTYPVVPGWKSFAVDEDRPDKPRRFGVTEIRGPYHTSLFSNNMLKVIQPSPAFIYLIIYCNS